MDGSFLLLCCSLLSGITRFFGIIQSDWSKVLLGLAQGFILGLLLYILYTADLHMVFVFGVVAHQYADDTWARVHG